jgi:hypothetical protein
VRGGDKIPVCLVRLVVSVHIVLVQRHRPRNLLRYGTEPHGAAENPDGVKHLAADLADGPVRGESYAHLISPTVLDHDLVPT